MTKTRPDAIYPTTRTRGRTKSCILQQVKVPHSRFNSASALASNRCQREKVLHHKLYRRRAKNRCKISSIYRMSRVL